MVTRGTGVVCCLCAAFAQVAAVPKNPAKWDYVSGGDAGPEVWGEIGEPDYPECKGREQSPINIVTGGAARSEEGGDQGGEVVAAVDTMLTDSVVSLDGGVGAVVSIDTEAASGLDGTTGSFYRWDGSLTTPPCAEHVKWFLSKRVVKISEDALHSYTNHVESQPGHGIAPSLNNRPVQPLYSRTVTEGFASDIAQTFAASTARFEVEQFFHAPRYTCSSGDCGSVTVEGEIYKLIQIHFHARAENTINGAT